MRYSEPKGITKEVAESILRDGSSSEICRAIVDIVHSDIDWRWAQNVCLKFSESDDHAIAHVSVVCLGHIARINDRLDKLRVVKRLEELKENPRLAGAVENAFDDISGVIDNVKEGVAKGFIDLYDAATEASRKFDSTEDMEPFFLALLNYIKGHPDLHQAMGEFLVAVIESSRPLSRELYGFCMRELRWEDVYEAAKKKFEADPYRNSDMRDIMSAYEPEWEDAVFSIIIRASESWACLE